MRVGPGHPEPLGVTPAAGGANVAVYSAHASAIELSLFDAAGAVETARVALPARTGDVRHGFVEGLAGGARYGLRAHGPYAPHDGHRFNAAKLLVDPYARALDRPFALHPAMYGAGAADDVRDDTDSAPYVPKAIVAPWPAAAAAPRLRVPWSETVVYELHVRGFTRLHPDVPEPLSGTCAGLAHPAAIAHLTRLGVTTVELMPLAAAIDERHLLERGLTNYWGYNPVAPFVPDPRLAPGGMAEVRDCVAALHAAGLEVILDVVLNHTGEGDARGPTLSLRGLDNLTYYRTLAGDRARYADDTGCGHALALDRPPALRLAMDALRHWAQAAGVDGFRFDLGTTLGRRDDGFDPAAPLLQAIAQDPLLRDLKIVAEPWDVGYGGYRLGGFPAPWGEWNDRFRDAARRYWRGDAGTVGELATRLAGSADVFAARARPPSRSVNFVAAHDGFTLADLVAYGRKHNEANGEDNRDGTDANLSWNHGVEGQTTDPAIAAARARDVRNLLATLLVARGTPMLAMGDELGRTQHGNNNGYAQDNATTWLDWARADRDLAACAARLVAVRRAHVALRADRWLDGTPQDDTGIADVEWRHPDGRPMGDAWTRADVRALVAVFSTTATAAVDADRVAIAFNAGDAPATVRWPDARAGFAWCALVDTSSPTGDPASATVDAAPATVVPGHAVVAVAEEALNDARRGGQAPTQDELDRLAAAAGIAADWWDVGGTRHVVNADTQRALLAAMGFPAATRDDARSHLAALAALRTPAADGERAAARCYLPDALRAGARRFGLAAHLYALRRAGDIGVGDFTTLARAAEATARAGGSLVGVNPLHALFGEDRERASPYHPSDRRFLDPLYIDVAAVPDLAVSAEARALLDRFAPRITGLEARSHVDYAGVWDVKRAVLAACFAAFAQRAPDDALAAEFDRFVAAGGTSLARFALFEAIAATHPRVPWQQWPDGLRTPDARGAAAFAAHHAPAVRFALYLQWQADRQLAAAAARARQAGLAFGFYRDLAVGAAPDGAEVWANPAAFACGVSIGAPPDPFSPSGQVWCLPPPNPHAIRASGAAGWRELLAANMRHAGALRIDHVMGLARLFWVPDGATATDGAYVDYPLALQLSVLAQQSASARCIVVGEDLGTVPDGFRDRLAAADVLSYRVLWFEREGAGFLPPGGYPPRAVACVSTHDLPTIAGWWRGADVDEKEALGLLAADAAAAARSDRQAERGMLATALDRAGIARVDPAAAPDAALAAAIHGFIGAAPSALAVAQADDLAGATTALNLPATDQARPNWRRRIDVDVDALWATETGARTAAAFAARATGGRG